MTTTINMDTTTSNDDIIKWNQTASMLIQASNLYRRVTRSKVGGMMTATPEDLAFMEGLIDRLLEDWAWEVRP